MESSRNAFHNVPQQAKDNSDSDGEADAGADTQPRAVCQCACPRWMVMLLLLANVIIAVALAVVAVAIAPPWARGVLSATQQQSDALAATVDVEQRNSSACPASRVVVPTMAPVADSSDGVYDRVAAEQRSALLALLHAEREQLRARYAFPLDDGSVYFHTQPTLARSSLGARLTATYFGWQPAFVLGVTGGSSSAGTFSWPHLLERYLRSRLNLTVDLRNAAQGSTSQQHTAACVRQLVGTKHNQATLQQDGEDGSDGGAMDLLMWEFAMNDETWWVHRPDGHGGGFSTRRRVTDIWMRGALQQRPASLGFLHFWDILIGDWRWDDAELPDRAWEPTNSVVRQYGAVVDAFAVNVVRFIRQAPGAVSPPEQSSLLRDHHHPNAAVYNISVDLLAHGLLCKWIDYLQHGPLPTSRLDPLLVVSPAQYELRQVPAELPGADLRGRCLMARTPQFGVYNPMAVRCVALNDSTGQAAVDKWMAPNLSQDHAPCLGWATSQGGRADPDRADRAYSAASAPATTPSRCALSGFGTGNDTITLCSERVLVPVERVVVWHKA